MANEASSKEAPWSAGLRGARANLGPGLALQMVALALVLAFFWHPTTHDLLTRLSVWRADLGVVFAVVSTGVFGGLLPFLFLKMMRATRSRYSWGQGAAITAFWAYKGLEIDLWYRVLARVVGEGNGVGVVASKMFLDQFIYCPLIAIPITVIAYDLVEQRGRARIVWADMLTRGWYGRRVLPLLISNLGVWVPAVCIIYALPTPLQLPMQNVVLCFFTLMVAHISQRRAD